MSGFLDPANQKRMHTSSFEHAPAGTVLTVLLIGWSVALARWVRRRVRRA